ncbi:MAG: iron-sulfur cluster assembly accessory protein, partial [Bdellovibrionales bacterium]|nr:iron-sulfur cluster assembly accessory protein [Bdellovibrionales bacterium]
QKRKRHNQLKNLESEILDLLIIGGGFEYGFSFDDVQEEDNIVDARGVRLLIDPYSAPFIKSSVIDYYEDFRGAGFSVKNPNAKSTCGCGLSFSV